LDFVARVREEIGAALRTKSSAHVVCVRSTMLPGSTDDVVTPALVRGFGGALPPRVEVAVNPEFLREGSAVADFFQPPKTVVGSADPKTAATVVGLYAGIEAPVFMTSIRVAETVKYVDIVFHATKIAFANECEKIWCRRHEVSVHLHVRYQTQFHPPT
jgi:GDP-mannose 6-dehydrogenase